MVKNKSEQLSTDDKLDVIVEYLHRLDRRDRLRTWGSFFKGILGLIPIIAFVWGSWYFYEHGDEIMEKIAKVAAEQAAEATKSGTENFIKQFQNFQSN